MQRRGGNWADSQESYGDYKLTADKLSPTNWRWAVLGWAIWWTAFSRPCGVAEWSATSEKEILKLLRPRLREFCLTEVAAYPDKRVSKRITAVLCLKHKPRPGHTAHQVSSARKLALWPDYDSYCSSEETTTVKWKLAPRG
jgi:hypothetical protein